jgi:hypothetical protein
VPRVLRVLVLLLVLRRLLLLRLRLRLQVPARPQQPLHRTRHVGSYGGQSTV